MTRRSLKAIGFVLAFLIMAIVGLVFGRILAGGQPLYPLNLSFPMD
ncbi:MULTISPECIES: hypothetical protein [Methylobacterium]